MVEFRFNKVTELPDPLQPSEVYIVPSAPGYADMFVSDAAGADALQVSTGGGGDTGGGWYATQWAATFETPLPLANGSVLRLTGILQDADKRPVSTDNPDYALSIIGGANGYLLPSYTGSEKLTFRANITLGGLGGTRMFRFLLRRQTDDSLVSVIPVVIDPNDVPELVMSTTTVSYIFGEADPFVSGGVYVQIANNSGVSTSIAAANLLIFREPQ